MVLKHYDNYVKIHSEYEALLMTNQDKIYWKELSYNHAAIKLLTANQDKIDWDGFSNTLFFEYDYDRIKHERKELNEAIISAVHHSSRIQKWLDGETKNLECAICCGDFENESEGCPAQNCYAVFHRALVVRRETSVRDVPG